jgi:hypothetical protein
MTNRPAVAAGFAAVVLFALLAGCSSSAGSGGQGCDAPTIEGTPFGSKGTAVLRGTGTLPDGIPNGLQLEILVHQGSASYGVLPDNLFAPDSVCGKTVHYVVKSLAAGTYTLEYDVFDPKDTKVQAVYQGTATEPFTIADGETKSVDTTFVAR